MVILLLKYQCIELGKIVRADLHKKTFHFGTLNIETGKKCYQFLHHPTRVSYSFYYSKEYAVLLIKCFK